MNVFNELIILLTLFLPNPTSARVQIYGFKVEMEASLDVDTGRQGKLTDSGQLVIIGERLVKLRFFGRSDSVSESVTNNN